MTVEDQVKVEVDPMVIIKPEYNGPSDVLDTKELFSMDSPPPKAPSPRPKSPSRSPTRSPVKKRVKKEPESQLQIIDHLPTAWDEAHATFTALERCVYERKDMGLSREQDEMMICDCVYDKHDPNAKPCGSPTDCINRAIFIECLADECRARSQCQNQRFTKRQYAPINIVQTEMKGFGLRAEDNIPSGSLVYEYIGEVVQEKTFRKRMQQYADEGIRHFYFMMLQKEEYIDATKKGGIGRFANHSCNPNSEVQKWVVGRRLRMGIFTKRDVVKGEEITFNYNVDRYGHDAQICYCGEPNCVGTIGGKTQTDIGTINDLFLDALGIADEVEELGLKGSKKKKSRQLDEDWIPTLRPIETEQEVQKVAAAIRQSSENTKMMGRLLERVNMTEEPLIHRQLMRMHGFGLMNMILTQLSDERDIVLLALESMNKWKLQIRNKIEDTNIEEPVTALSVSDDSQISSLAKQLLAYWATLELSYRIPRKPKIKSLDEEDEAATTTIAEADSLPSYSELRRPQAWENTNSIQIEVAPIRARPLPFARPRPPVPPIRPPPPQPTQSASRSKLDAIIALAQQNIAITAATPTPVPPESPVAESSRSGSRTDEREPVSVDRRKRQKRDDDESKKEKRLKILVGDVVVKSMSKYREQMDHETFKRYAKECTAILVDKEKKGHSYSSARHPTLSDDKRAKIKSFTKEYTHKLLKRLKEKGKLRRPNTQHSGSSTHSTPIAATPSTDLTAPSSGVLGTPNGHGDLVTDIFGDGSDDEIGEDMDIETDADPSPAITPITDKFSFSPIVDKSNGTNGAVRVDSFRPGMNGVSVPPPISMDTPSRTPTSGSGPSPADAIDYHR